MVPIGPITQVASVGAGTDTRAFRLGLASDVVFFGLGRYELLELKDRRLIEARARSACERRVAPVGPRRSLERRPAVRWLRGRGTLRLPR